MAKMIIYNNPNRQYLLQGDYDDFDGAELDLTNVKRGLLGLAGRWNDVVSWVKVESGVWRLYEHINRGGDHWDYGEGLHYVGDKGISGFEPIA